MDGQFIDYRSEYDRVKAQLQAAGVEGARLTQSDLVLIKEIDPTKSTYLFDLLDTQTTTLLPEEIRLNSTDEFLVQKCGIYLWGRQVSFDDATVPVAVADFPRWYTYTPTEFDSLYNKSNGLYDGFMTITTNNIKYTDNWLIKKHNKIPRTQFVDELQQADNNFMGDGQFIMLPNTVLSGAKKTAIQIFLPKAIDQSTATWHGLDGLNQELSITHIAIWFQGLLGQNLSSFQN